MPTFATVGALAAFLLVRGTIFREARRPLGETPADRVGAPAVAPPPMAAFEPSSDRDVIKEKRQPGSVRGPREERGEPLAKPGVPGGPEQAVDRRQAVARKNDGKRDDLRGAMDGRSRDERRPARAAAPAPLSAGRLRSAGAALDGESSGGSYPAAGVAAAPEAERRKGGAPSSRERSDGFAQPPPGPRPPEPAPAVASPPPSTSRPAAAAASAPVRDDRLLGAVRKDKKPSVDETEGTAVQADERAAAPAASRSVDPARALADRAAKLLAAHRFTEASAAYRELLRRFPDHPSAPSWRARLAASEQAATSDTTPFAAPPPAR